MSKFNRVADKQNNKSDPLNSNKASIENEKIKKQLINRY